VSGQVRIEHHLTSFAVGLQILRNDIDVARQEYLVQPPEHSRHVAVNMAESRTERVGLQLDLREIYGTHRRAAVEIIKHLSGYFFADSILRSFGRTANSEQLPDHLNVSRTQMENVSGLGLSVAKQPRIYQFDGAKPHKPKRKTNWAKPQ